jgi:hypothetical protein
LKPDPDETEPRFHDLGCGFFMSEGNSRRTKGWPEVGEWQWEGNLGAQERILANRHEVAGGWYDFVAGDLKDRQNPALYQPKCWAGHPVDIFFSFFRSILLRSKDSYITDRFCQQSICYNGGLFLIAP